MPCCIWSPIPTSAPNSLPRASWRVAALRDVLTAFKAEGLPSPAEMEAAVERDIDRLQGMQNDDGGFPYWRRGTESIPFNTHPRRPRPVPRRSKGLCRPGRHAAARPRIPAQDREPLSRAGTASRPAGRSAPTPSTCATCLATATRRKPQAAERSRPGKPVDGGIGWLWPVLTMTQRRPRWRPSAAT